MPYFQYKSTLVPQETGPALTTRVTKTGKSLNLRMEWE